MVQLKELAALMDPDLIISIHIAAHNTAPENATPSSDQGGRLHACGRHRHPGKTQST